MFNNFRFKNLIKKLNIKYYFFLKKTSKDLTKKLLIVINKKKQLKKNQDLSKINQKKLGNHFLKLIDKILND